MYKTGSKIVFIIQSCEGSQEFQKEWGKNIRHSVLRILYSFDGNNFLKSSCNAKNSESTQLKWAYKFVNTGGQKSGSIRQELKDFTLSEFTSFEDEIRYLEGEKSDDKSEMEYFSGGARILREEFMSVVHDYEWEDSNLISPIKIKKRKKLMSFCGNKPSEKRNDGTFNSIIKTQKSEKNKACQNIVILISAVPTTHGELNSYFDWHVEDVDYVTNTLMPSHLQSYFKEKHNIKLLWINNGSLTSDKNAETTDVFGMEIMRKFVTSIGGSIVPISILCSDLNPEKAENRTSHYTRGPTQIYLNKFSKLDTESAKEDNTVHICRKFFSELHGLQIQKFSTVSLTPVTIDSEPLRKLLKLECTSCCMTEDVATSSGDTYCQINAISNKEIQVSFCDSVINARYNSSDVKPETVFMVYGYLPHSYLSFFMKNNLSMCTYPMWCEVLSTNSYTPYSLVVKAHKYCTMCGEEPCIDHCGTSRFAVFQFIDHNLALVMFMSSLSSRNVSMLLNNRVGWMDEAIIPNQPQILNNTQPGITESIESGFCDPKPFSFAMMENLNITSVGMVFDDILQKDDSVSSQSSVQDDIFSELKTWYESKSQTLTKCEKQGSSTVEKQLNMTEFDSVEAMASALCIEYNKIFDVEIDTSVNQDISTHYCSSILQTAQTISSVVSHHARITEEPRWKEICDEIFTKYFYCTANDIRKRTGERSQGKLQESILQILLRLELTSLLQSPMDDLSDVVDEICSFLRLISLSISPLMMTRCLEHVFVENYSSTCGELLCEVHNELMQPIPVHLKSYCTGIADDSCDMSVLNSVLGSARSSVSSYSSLAGPDSNSRKPMRRISSFPQISRQIEVPGKVENKGKKSDTNENIKGRLRSSSKKVIAPSTGNVTGSKEVGRVKRDLFSVSNMDKPASNQDATLPVKTIQQRRMSVSDTPDGKQRMTALSRQRLRMHREQRAKEEVLTIIEESPAKLDDVQPTFSKTDKKNPHHKVSLTRRHSFYCDGNESRTVARAKVLKQHHEAAPATPFRDSKKKDPTSSLISSPNSLLFSQNHQSFLSPAKMNIPFCDDSPAKNTRSHATKALFQSPKQKDKSQPMNEKQKRILFDNNSSDILSVKSTDEVFIKGVQPISQSPFKTPRKSALKSLQSPLKSTETFNTDMAVNFCQMSKFEDVFLENSTVLDTIENNKPQNVQNFPDIIALADSPQVMKKTSDSKSQVTLDAYVIRTPRSCSTNSNEKSREVRKRKWSLDSTPTRDDINQWPRKKRGVDKSSPGIVSKKSKKNDENTTVLIKNMCDFFLPEKDTNENILSSEEYSVLPTHSGAHDTLKKCQKHFEFEDQDCANLSNEPQKLSARSLLHIQNSPILTPNRRKKNQKI